MTTLNLQVNASADDSRMSGIPNDSGRNVTNSGTCSINDSPIGPGSHGANDEYTCAFRFTGVTIPQDAMISSASFRLIPSTTYNASPNVIKFYVSAQAADNAAALTTTNGNLNTTARPRSAATVAWTQTNLTIDVEESISVTSVIQEIVSRAGWASGNAIVILVDTHEDTTVSEWSDYYSHDQSTTKAAKLDIDYTVGGQLPYDVIVGRMRVKAFAGYRM